MHEIHVIEAEYDSLTRCPEDDKHLLLARAIVNGGMTTEQIKQAEKVQRIARLIANHRAKANATRKAVAEGFREFGDLKTTAEKMGYSYDSVARYVSQARKLGELPKKGKTK